MKTSITKEQNYFFIGIFIAMIILSIFIIKPFIIIIITASILAFLLLPVYKFLYKKTKRPNLSAIVTIILLILVLLVPLAFVSQKVSQEAYKVYIITKDHFNHSPEYAGCAQGIQCMVTTNIEKLINHPTFGKALEQILKSISNYLMTSSSKIVIGVSTFMLNLALTLFLTFYLLRDGDKLINTIKKHIGLRKDHQEKLFSRIHDVSHAVIYGHFLTAVIQGMLGLIGFLIFGIPSALFLGVITVFFSLIPFVGPIIIWIPAGIYKIYSGIITQSTWAVIQGIGLLIYGFFIISAVDNFIKPKIIGDKARIHPAIVFIGVVGGIALLGAVGILIGPLILALTSTFITIWTEMRMA